MGANIHAKAALETAKKAIREADRAEAEAWPSECRAPPRYHHASPVLVAKSLAAEDRLERAPDDALVKPTRHDFQARRGGHT